MPVGAPTGKCTRLPRRRGPSRRPAGRRGAEDVHQIRGDVAHGLGDRDAAEHLRVLTWPPSARRRGPAGTRRLVVDSGDAPRRGPPPRRAGGRARSWPRFLQAAVVALDRAVFGVERLPQHGPAAVDLADPVLVVDADVAVEGDVGAVAVDGADSAGSRRPASRAERGTSSGSGAWRVRVGVGDQEDVLGVVRIRCEHLRAVDDPARRRREPRGSCTSRRRSRPPARCSQGTAGSGPTTPVAAPPP